MKADIVLGIQWGDEGKGRVVDSYCADYDVVARFGGGDNAGHTLVVGDRKLALRIVPSGVLQARPDLFIGGGTVVSLEGLIMEIDMLAGIGIDVSRIKISDRAHVVFPYHAALDRANEQSRGDAAIGTTGRGIGPAYTDKAARFGITFGDLRKREALADKIRYNLVTRSAVFAAMGSMPREEEVVGNTLSLLPRVLPHVVDGVGYIHEALEGGKKILIEGAQGTLLDVGYGTYPYVTSSHTIAGGACIGLGIGPTAIGSVVGIAKAYCTRVGAGGSGASRAWRRVRNGNRPSAAVRLVRCGRRALRRARQRTHERGNHEARRPHGPRKNRDRHRLSQRWGIRRLRVCKRARSRTRVRMVRRLDRGSLGDSQDRRSAGRRASLRFGARSGATRADRSGVARTRAGVSGGRLAPGTLAIARSCRDSMVWLDFGIASNARG
jgi:hypothetical protein